MAIDEVGLGKLLQNARKHAGLTQQQLCGKADLSYSTLAKIERGAIKAPSIFTVIAVAEALGVSLAELLGNKAPSNNSAVEKKTSKGGIKFVYFDINGCLVRFFQRAFAKLAEETGAPADVIETFFWRHNDNVNTGNMSLADFNNMFAEKLGIESLDWTEYYLSSIEPINEMHELVVWATKHYKVGLLSNIMPGFIEEMLKRGLLPNVDYAAIIDSSKTGAIKPEPKIYEAAAYYTGCQPHETLLVDDTRINLKAAEHEGWKVMWFDDYHPKEGVKRIKKALEY